MNRIKLSFKKNFSWTFFGNIIYALSQWGIIALLANIGNAKMVGEYSLGLAITAPIVLFFNFQLRSIIATDTKNQFDYATYFGSRIIFQLVALLIIFLVLSFSSYRLSLIVIIMVIGLLKVVESLSELSHGYMQKVERMDYAGKSQIIKGLVSIIAVGISLYMFNSLIISLVMLLIAWLIRLISYDLRVVSKFTNIVPEFNKKNIIKIFLMTVPLGIVSILNSLNTNIPRYFIEYHIGIEELGYFSAIAYLLVAGNLLIRPLSTVAAPRLASYYNSGDIRNFLKINLVLICFAVILGIILILISYYFGELILSLVYTSEFAMYSDIFTLIMVGSAISFLTTFLNISIVAARIFKLQPIINLITTIVAIVGSFILIPNYGITGAAYVLLIVNFVQFIGSFTLFILAIIKIRR